MTPDDVLIQVSYPSSNRDGRQADVAVCDRVSGQTLTKGRLSSDELLTFKSRTRHLSRERLLAVMRVFSQRDERAAARLAEMRADDLPTPTGGNP